MKVLQLGKFYPIQGGVEKVMFDLTTGLSEKYNDIECDMLCVSAENTAAYSISLNKRSTLYCAKLDKKLFSTMLSRDLITTLRKMCKNYDIIHIHHPDPMAAVALRLSGFKGKVVLHWHSDILKQKLLLKFYRPIQNWLIKRADIIVGTTPKYLSESPHLTPFNTPKIAIPIGIRPIIYDLKRVNDIKEKYPHKKIIFSLGRLVGYKGFEYLIQAGKYLSNEYVILIGGSGPLQNQLSNLIKENGLHEKVKLLGRIDDDDLPNYYGACNLFVLSSIWKTEAFGIVQIEAMSCGKPVIATKIPESGVDWVNQNEYSGINVTPCDSKSIADAINYLTSSPNIYNQFSINSKERFEACFTLDSMIENCRSIYNSII